MSSELEIVDVDETGRITLPQKICEKIGIHPHDKLIIGTLKKSLIFERDIDKAGKNDMPV